MSLCRWVWKMERRLVWRQVDSVISPRVKKDFISISLPLRFIFRAPWIIFPSIMVRRSEPRQNVIIRTIFSLCLQQVLRRLEDCMEITNPSSFDSWELNIKSHNSQDVMQSHLIGLNCLSSNTHFLWPQAKPNPPQHFKQFPPCLSLVTDWKFERPKLLTISQSINRQLSRCKALAPSGMLQFANRDSFPRERL